MVCAYSSLGHIRIKNRVELSVWEGYTAGLHIIVKIMGWNTDKDLSSRERWSDEVRWGQMRSVEVSWGQLKLMKSDEVMQRWRGVIRVSDAIQWGWRNWMCRHGAKMEARKSAMDCVFRVVPSYTVLRWCELIQRGWVGGWVDTVTIDDVDDKINQGKRERKSEECRLDYSFVRGKDEIKKKTNWLFVIWKEIA